MKGAPRLVDAPRWALAVGVASLGLVAFGGCEKPPPPPSVEAGVASAKKTPPVAVPSSVMCFGAKCAPGELCLDASHAEDAAAPYACYRAPAECGAKPTCDCLVEHGTFVCDAPNKLLCNDLAGGEPQVVCVHIYQ